MRDHRDFCLSFLPLLDNAGIYANIVNFFFLSGKVDLEICVHYLGNKCIFHYRESLWEYLGIHVI